MVGSVALEVNIYKGDFNVLTIEGDYKQALNYKRGLSTKYYGIHFSQDPYAFATGLDICPIRISAASFAYNDIDIIRQAERELSQVTHFLNRVMYTPYPEKIRAFFEKEKSKLDNMKRQIEYSDSYHKIPYNDNYTKVPLNPISNFDLTGSDLLSGISKKNVTTEFEIKKRILI